jgi:hypothetical protein
LKPCKLKAFPQKDSPFLCCISKHFQKLKRNKFPKNLYKKLEKLLLHLKLQCWKPQKLEELSFTRLNLKLETSRLEEHSSTLKNLQHFEKVSSTPRTHLEKLQALCMPPLGNELPLTLQTKNLVSKRILSFFSYAIQAQTFHYFLF